MEKNSKNQNNEGKRFDRCQGKWGVTLPGVIMALLIGSVALMGVFTMVRQGTSLNATNNAMTNVSVITENIRSQFQSETNFAALSNTVAINGGSVPTDWVSGTSITNGWNGSVTIAAGTPNTRFSIALAGVPQDACNKLGSFRQGEWASVTINATTIAQTGSIAAAVSGACAASNTVTFISNK